MAAAPYLPLERAEPRAMLAAPDKEDASAVGVVAFLAALFSLAAAVYLLSRRR